jgi:hypothetical protein
VERYYSDIRDMPAISDQDMNAMLAEESRVSYLIKFVLIVLIFLFAHTTATHNGVQHELCPP